MVKSHTNAVTVDSDPVDRPDEFYAMDSFELDIIPSSSAAELSGYEHGDRHDQRYLLPPPAFGEQQAFNMHKESTAQYHATEHKFARTSNIKEKFEAQKAAVSVKLRRLQKFVSRSGRLEIPDGEAEDGRLARFSRKWNLDGWRFGVFVASIGVTFCLVIEIVMLVTALIIDRQNERSGELYVGECKKVDHMTTALALILNIVATVLISTSNYVMQCLSAPTRKDIDIIHAARSYLNIGSSSVHNLVYNPSVKTFLWLSLILTSIPIHLLFNSAFFGALQGNNYGILVTSESALKGPPSAVRYKLFNNTPGYDTVDLFLNHMRTLWSEKKLVLLNKDDCFRTYSTQLPSTATNVIVVTKQTEGQHCLLPDTRAEITYDDVDPYTAFSLPIGVGLYLSPFIGNAVPLLSPNYTQSSAALPQNVSGGLYMRSPASYQRDGILSTFTSFDYHYWTAIKKLKYDFNDSTILRAGMWSPTSWMCNISDVLAGNICTSGKNPKRPEPWFITPANVEVDHCLSQPSMEQCSLHYSWIILAIVIACDVAKIIIMLVTLFVIPELPLATLGDAISSFLEIPDPHTQDCCLLEQSEALDMSQTTHWVWNVLKIGNAHPYQRTKSSIVDSISQVSSRWNVKASRWSSVPSRKRWVLFAALYIFLLSSSLAVLGICVRNLGQKGITTPLNQGFGSTNPNAIFTNPGAFLTRATNSTGAITTVPQNTNSALFSNIVFANIPQLLFSMLYFVYNGMLTSMFTAAEWTKFAEVRKALRVSTPRTGQRSTYWLQLPWKYSLPIVMMSALIHWLVSRSLFLVRINVFSWEPVRGSGGQINLGVLGPSQGLLDRDIYACGYSPLAMLLLIIVVVLSLVVIIAISRRSFSGAIPMCGTNSLAISAACHYANDGDLDVACRPLMWGVTRPATLTSPGHCSMSDRDVGKPVIGMEYR